MSIIITPIFIFSPSEANEFILMDFNLDIGVRISGIVLMDPV